MGVQTAYNFGMQKGVPGGLYDIAPYENHTYIVSGTVTFGIGVVSSDGCIATVPTADSTVENFAGMAMNGFTTQQDMKGNVVVEDGQSIGVLKYGNAWGVLGKNAVPARNKDVYLITSGEEAGYFTTTEDASTKIALKASFIDQADNGIAPVRFYNQK